jgi:hypothetical protein
MNWKLAAMAMGASLFLCPVVRAEDDLTVKPSVDTLIESAANTDWQDPALKRGDYDKVKAELSDAIEANVVFKVNQKLSTIWKHLQDPGTLGKALPFIEKDSYKPTLVENTDSAAHYKVKLTIVPLENKALPKLVKTEMNIDLFINKGAKKEDALALHWELDPTAKNDWKRATSHVYAVDLHNGKTLVCVTSSTISNYPTPRGKKLDVAKVVLSKMKATITAWAEGLKD